MSEIENELEVAVEGEAETVVIDPEPEREAEGRCEAETTVGGNLYRCGLETMHDGEHAFVSVAGEVLDAPSEVDQAAAEDMEQVQALSRAVKNYAKAVVGVLGSDLGDFTICPCCSPRTPGLYIQHEHSPEEIATLKSILGMPSLENYKRANAYMVCATCDGLGTVLTGSMVPAHMTHQCVDCQGRGYIAHDAKWEGPAKAPILETQANGHEEVPGEPPAFDPWGRPYGDPDYYRMPIVGVTT